MRIAVDAFPLTARALTGIPNYVKNLLLHIARLDEKNEYFLFSKNGFHFFPRENLHMRFGASASGALPSYGNSVWLFTKGVWMMKKDNIDLFWGTRQMLPPYLPGSIKKVLTVYDLVWHYLPETMERYNLFVLKVIARRSIRAADHIITISEATARSLVEELGVEREKISVAYPAADYSPLDRKGSAEYISEKYGTNRDYALTVSTVEPRKNLKLLLRVFSGLRDEGLQLLVAGAPGWKTSSVRGEYDRLGLTEREVKFLGYVPEEDMNRLYSGALLFVFPSVYEGFGIPPLEAMASGTPVIVSGASSLPEVVGDAGMLLDPNDEGGWAEAIVRVAGDGDLRERMGRMGLERAGLFSWEESARRTLEVLNGTGP